MSILEEMVADVRLAMQRECWHSGLALALALPDICAYLETPTEKSGARYTRRFETWLQKEYIFEGSGPDRMGKGSPYIVGEDCYALRCAFLHNGDLDLTSQHVQELLERVEFVAVKPTLPHTIHKNGSVKPDGNGGYIFTRLQLQVDIFCEDLCFAVENWIASVVDQAVLNRIAALPKIVRVGR